VKQAVASREFESAMASLGTTVAYLDGDEWGDRWPTDMKLINETLRRIGKLE
jgi:tripartite-type tricarboxylate transporter receptor subunit TctC